MPTPTEGNDKSGPAVVGRRATVILPRWVTAPTGAIDCCSSFRALAQWRPAPRSSAVGRDPPGLVLGGGMPHAQGTPLGLHAAQRYSGLGDFTAGLVPVHDGAFVAPVAELRQHGLVRA